MEVYLKLVKIYKESATSFSPVKKCAAEFKLCRTYLGVDPREGRPRTATAGENILTVHNMVLDDQQLKVCDNWGRRYIRRKGTLYFASGIKYEKALCKIREKMPGLRKKKFSFIRTMHLPTQVLCQWEN